ncbi:hypothetical protein Goe25_01690 [Bacillus phage vB_BsuM-Goe25]|nr:hypothetical protein BSP14_159 [Bacillus phage BSP14]WCS69797.1 hypothetical protein Goe25_01690 [Bacillus phage vB_BsuM-Goe25]
MPRINADSGLGLTRDEERALRRLTEGHSLKETLDFIEDTYGEWGPGYHTELSCLNYIPRAELISLVSGANYEIRQTFTEYLENLIITLKIEGHNSPSQEKRASINRLIATVKDIQGQFLDKKKKGML